MRLTASLCYDEEKTAERTERGKMEDYSINFKFKINYPIGQYNQQLFKSINSQHNQIVYLFNYDKFLTEVNR